MRADRLLSLLLLLQTRGRLTARRLAQELEVSERTIYRDIDALGAAGVPVYGEAGRRGGYALLEPYRTSLTGLTDGELRALFMLSLPGPLAELGLSQEFKAAWLKISAGLPEERRGDEARARQRFHLDPGGWEQEQIASPHLQILYQAVWQDRCLELAYRPLPFIELEQRVEPYGLVAKAGAWYLVYAHQSRLRARRVVEITRAHLLEERFERRPDFDLADFWRVWCLERRQERALYRVSLRVSPAFLPWLSYLVSQPFRSLDQDAPPDASGWNRLELAFDSLEAAREKLLAFGGAVEVLAPAALRDSLVDYAAQIMARYTPGRLEGK